MDLTGQSDATSSLRKQVRNLTQEYNLFAGTIAGYAENVVKRDTLALQIEGDGNLDNSKASNTVSVLENEIDAAREKRPTNQAILENARLVVNILNSVDTSIDREESLPTTGLGNVRSLQRVQESIDRANREIGLLREKLGAPRTP
jgi:hypothetical protein